MNTIRSFKVFWSGLRLHTQLSIFIILVILFINCVRSYWMFSTKYVEMRATLKHTMTTVATGLSTNGMSAVLASDFVSLEKLLSSSLLFDDVISIRILGVDGKVLGYGDKNEKGMPRILYEPEFVTMPLTELSNGQVYFKEYGDIIELWYPVRSYEVVGWIHVMSSTARLSYELHNQLLKYIWLGFFIAFLISAVMYFVLRETLMSLSNATQFAKDLVVQKGKKFSSSAGSQETAELVKALNITSEELQHQQVSIEIQTQKLEKSLDELRKFNETLENKIQERTQDLQQANKDISLALKAKGEFLANMSHEIRTPLNAIIGITSVLSELKLGDEVKSYIKLQDTASRSLLHIINDILDIAKIEADELKLESIPFDMAELVLENLNLIMGAVEGKGIRISADFDPCKKCFYLGDPTRVSQILINLLNNAVKFTEKGEILIRAGLDEQGLIKFEIHDTGIGIPQENLKSIFEPFVQVDASVTRKFGGTGLGLSICRNLIKKMGGELWADSELGKGSHFYFTLNLPQATEAEVRDFEELKDREQQSNKYFNTDLNHKRRILLVDDDLDNYEILKIYFKDYPFELTVAVNGEEGVKKFQSEKFDLILMDMQMPVMDGLTATKKIRELEAAKNQKKIPVLMLTANAFKENYDASLKAGADEFITKPIRKSGLLAAIKKYFMP